MPGAIPTTCPACVFRSAGPRVLVLLSLALSGCGQGGWPTTYPVEGKVLVAGMPAAFADIRLWPRDPDQPRGAVGISAADGTFHLTTVYPKDGAVAGEYDVTVIWRDYSIPYDECEEPLHDRLALRYADRTKSGLRATIREGKNEMILNLTLSGSGWSLPRQHSTSAIDANTLRPEMDRK